jgi:hypothetical protein
MSMLNRVASKREQFLLRSWEDGNEQIALSELIEMMFRDNAVILERVVGPNSLRPNWTIVERGDEDDVSTYPPVLAELPEGTSLKVALIAYITTAAMKYPGKIDTAAALSDVRSTLVLVSKHFHKGP